MRTKVFLITAFVLINAAFNYKYQPFNRTLTENEICENNSTMVLGIFTWDSGWEKRRRQVMRETYQSSKDPRICTFDEFLSGDNPCCILSYAFVMGGGDEDAPTDHPNDSTPVSLDRNEVPKYAHLAEETDIIFLNIRENMNDGKSFTWPSYITSLEEKYSNETSKTRRPIDYVAKVDTDAVLNIPAVLDLLKYSLPPSSENPNIFGGYMRTVPYQEGTIPAVAGPFYFFSTDLASYFTQGLKREGRDEILKPYQEDHSHNSIFHNEDVAVSIIAHSNPEPITVRHLEGYFFHAKDEELFKRIWSTLPF